MLQVIHFKIWCSGYSRDGSVSKGDYSECMRALDKILSTKVKVGQGNTCFLSPEVGKRKIGMLSSQPTSQAEIASGDVGHCLKLIS